MKFNDMLERFIPNTFEEPTPIPGYKRVELRAEGKGTYEDPTLKHKDWKNKIGWFRNKHNMAFGWTIFTPSQSDIQWFNSARESLKDVYRVSSDKGTNLVKFKLKKGTMHWFDNAKLEETDEIGWEKAVPYTLVMVDFGKESEFGIPSKVWTT
jgi:hypothetical protein